MPVPNKRQQNGQKIRDNVQEIMGRYAQVKVNSIDSIYHRESLGVSFHEFPGDLWHLLTSSTILHQILNSVKRFFCPLVISVQQAFILKNKKMCSFFLFSGDVMLTGLTFSYCIRVFFFQNSKVIRMYHGCNSTYPRFITKANFGRYPVKPKRGKILRFSLFLCFICRDDFTFTNSFVLCYSLILAPA